MTFRVVRSLGVQRGVFKELLYIRGQEWEGQSGQNFKIPPYTFNTPTNSDHIQKLKIIIPTYLGIAFLTIFLSAVALSAAVLTVF